MRSTDLPAELAKHMQAENGPHCHPPHSSRPLHRRGGCPARPSPARPPAARHPQIRHPQAHNSQAHNSRAHLLLVQRLPVQRSSAHFWPACPTVLRPMHPRPAAHCGTHSSRSARCVLLSLTDQRARCSARHRPAIHSPVRLAAVPRPWPDIAGKATPRHVRQEGAAPQPDTRPRPPPPFTAPRTGPHGARGHQLGGRPSANRGSRSQLAGATPVARTAGPAPTTAKARTAHIPFVMPATSMGLPRHPTDHGLWNAPSPFSSQRSAS